MPTTFCVVADGDRLLNIDHLNILRRVAYIVVCALVWPLWSGLPCVARTQQESLLLVGLTAEDVLLLADPEGRIIYKRNETRTYVPASTLKILTALAAIHYMGTSFRFQTEFYLDPDNNLKVKGYGDPLLISESWQDIARALSRGLGGFKDLILDDSYFARNIHVPGVCRSTNPYDAPVGALCANFNTVFLEKDHTGRIVSAEPQTPITPLARKHGGPQGPGKGRYTLTHGSEEAALYAGELLGHFLQESGLNSPGRIRMGMVGREDRLFYMHRSLFTLEEALGRMLAFSNNFMANQILISLGAHLHGPPGTLDKGVEVLSHYAREVLRLNDIRIVEGSGISRNNRLSALDMLAMLRAFEPYRHLLNRNGRILYKSGTLEGLRTGAGYIESQKGTSHYFVLSLKGSDSDLEALIGSLAEGVNNGLYD